jgi:RNA polymerase sigma-70 factor, ECF subfamily
MSGSFSTARFPVLPLDKAKTPTDSLVDETASQAEEISDEVLLLEIYANNPEAMGILFRRYAALVRSIGRRILRDDAEAEDLVQEVFLYFFHRSSAFDSRKGSARSWIVQNIYYRAINRRRYLSSRHQLFVIASKPSLDQGGTAVYKSSETAIFDSALVQEILKGLTSEQFETMRLFFFEGYTLAEISQKFGQPLGNVRHHYYRGLNKLRARLFLE